MRACTCAGLSDLGPAAAEAIPAVVTCLKETNHAVFSSALNVAGSIVPMLNALLTLVIALGVVIFTGVRSSAAVAHNLDTEFTVRSPKSS